MSLVVAQVHEGLISLVSDTKVTRVGHDGFTRHVFENAFPKLLILRDNLCVGLAGNDPENVADALIGARHQSVEDIARKAGSMPHASIIVASLLPEPQLLQIVQGSIEDRTSLGRAWVGDPDAYSIFQQRYSGWPAGVEEPFLLVSSLQWLLSFGSIPSVGGYLTHIASTSNGFRYVPQTSFVGPEMLNSAAGMVNGNVEVRFSTPPSGDTTVHSHLCAVGVHPTPGALAYLLAPVGVAVLFPHDAPHKPIKMSVQSIGELVHRALAEHGQSLAA
jgi:hypothetical protein